MYRFIHLFEEKHYAKKFGSARTQHIAHQSVDLMQDLSIHSTYNLAPHISQPLPSSEKYTLVATYIFCVLYIYWNHQMLFFR